jgi:type VI secretion system secreted protein Hcp
MAVDYFLKLDNIQGESVTKGFENQIQLLSFSWGGSQVTSVAGTGGSGAGKVDLADLTLMKHLDSASPLIYKSLVAGMHIANGTLSACKAGAGGASGGSKAFLTITLGELFVTSMQLSGSSEIPTESISFSYNTIKYEYSKQNDQGNLVSTGPISYNLKTNQVS